MQPVPSLRLAPVTWRTARHFVSQNHRHQFYSNEAIATAIAYACYRTKLGGLLPLGWIDAAFVIVEAVFIATSRDTLNKYYTRSRQLLAR